MAIYIEPTRTKRAHRKNALLRHALRCIAHGYEHLEEHGNRDEHDLRRVGQAQQHDEHGQQHDLRQRVEEIQNRREYGIGARRTTARESQRNSEHRTDEHRNHHAVKAHEKRRPQLIEILRHHGKRVKRPRQHRIVHHHGSKLPTGKNEHDGERIACNAAQNRMLTHGPPPLSPQCRAASRAMRGSARRTNRRRASFPAASRHFPARAPRGPVAAT